MPMVIVSVGSSMRMPGRARGSSGSARVSPIMTSGMPATAQMPPGPTSSVETRSSPSVVNSSTTLTRSVVPSSRIQATCWPLRIQPLCTRHSASRPR